VIETMHAHHGNSLVAVLPPVTRDNFVGDEQRGVAKRLHVDDDRDVRGRERLIELADGRLHRRPVRIRLAHRRHALGERRGKSGARLF
jgi:hypothetical protein